MPHIFIDESGQFVKRDHEQYFVIASFTVGNPRRTAKQFRSWQHSKFPRKMRYQTELKYSEVKISDELRLATIRQIAKLDVRINYSYLLRQNIPDEYWRKEKIESGLLYTNIVGETIEAYLPISDFEFRVFCDRRHLKGVRLQKFREILQTRLLPQLPVKTIIQIEMVDSTTNVNVQIADWLAGALAAYHENKPLGAELFKILKNNIINGRELFEDHWQKNSNKKLSR